MTGVECTLINKINIGIIGDKRHAKRLRQVVDLSERANVKSIFHPQRKPDHPLGTTNLNDLKNCDAIIIAAPNDFHLDYLEKTSIWKKYIFLEKPIANDKKNLVKSLKIIRSGKVYVNYNYRFSEIDNAIKKYKDEIGNIISIDIFSGNGLSFKKTENLDWRLSNQKSSDIVLRTKSIHWIDYLLYKFGHSQDIRYHKKSFGPNQSLDTAIVEMNWAKGPNARIIASYASPLIFQINLIGNNGILLMDSESIKISSPRDTFNEDGFFSRPPSKEVNYPGTHNLYFGSLVNSFEYFIDYVQEKCPIPPEIIEQSISTELLINSIVDPIYG